MDQKWVNALLEKAKKRGFSDFEIYIESSKHFSISVFEGELDKFSSSQPYGISVRGIYNGKMGNAYTEKTDSAALDLLVEDCLTNAVISETEEIVEIFAPAATYPRLTESISDLNEMSSKEKIDLMKNAEKMAMDLDGRVDQVQNKYGDASTKIGIFNTKGLSLEYDTTMGYLYFAPIAKAGEETKNESVLHFFKNSQGVKADLIAKMAVEKTLKMMGAQILASGSYKTIISGKSMAELMNVMGAIFSAEAADKGLTHFKNQVGEMVASPLVTFVENPHLQDGFATMPFDSEGVPTQKKQLIDQGKLTGFLHNLKTAKKWHVPPTGNGFKASFKSPIGISATNFYLEPGTETLEKMMMRVEEGIYLTALDGLNAGINAITGEFSLSCRGFKIESGMKTTPIHQMTVSGNYFDVLKSIEGIADDFAFEALDSIAVYGAPSVYVGKLVLSGK